MPPIDEIIASVNTDPKTQKAKADDLPSWTKSDLKRVADNAAVSADTQNTEMNRYRIGIADKYMKSLADPEEIKALRAQAMQAINRGATANATPGETGGFNAAQWQNLQGILPTIKNVGSMGTYGVPQLDFSNQIASAERNTKYNQDFGNSELDKVAPDIEKLQALAELGYGNDVFNRNPRSPQAIIDQQVKKAQAFKIGVDANTAQQLQDLTSGQAVKANTADTAFGKVTTRPSFYNPEEYLTELTKQYPDQAGMINDAATAVGNPDPSQAKAVAEKNATYQTSAAPLLNQSAFRSPAAFAQLTAKAFNNLDSLKNTNWSTNLQNGLKGIDPANYVSDNLWQSINKKLGAGGGELNAVLATMSPIQLALTPEQRQEMAGAVLNQPTLDTTSLKEIISRYANIANTNYKTAALTSDIVQTDPSFLKGASRAELLQSAIGKSAFVAQEPVNGHDFQSWWLNKNLTPAYKKYFQEHPKLYGAAMLDLVKQGSTPEAYDEFKTWAKKAPANAPQAKSSVLGTSLGSDYISPSARGRAIQQIQPKQNQPEATPANNPTSPNLSQLLTGNI